MYKIQIQTNFNEFVKEQAKVLLDEVKSNCSNYGEVKRELQNLLIPVKCSDGSPNYFLMVKSEAECQIRQEIDATALGGVITSTEIK